MVCRTDGVGASGLVDELVGGGAVFGYAGVMNEVSDAGLINELSGGGCGHEVVRA
jgi:hypothetical protein